MIILRTGKQKLLSNVTHPVIQPRPAILSVLRQGGWKAHPCYNVFLSMLFSIFRTENILPAFFPIEDNPGIYLRHHPGLVIRNAWNWRHKQTEEHLLVSWSESFHFSPSKSQKPTHPGYESFYPHVQFLSFYYFTVSQCERKGGNSSLRNAINFKEVRFKRLQIRF